ncbi:MAG: hypothetical protein ABGX16_19840 [Pirellulales bacterium]
MAKSTISDQLRAAASKQLKNESLNSLARDSGIDPAALWRFLNGGGCRAITFDLLAAHLGLELKPKKKK